MPKSLEDTREAQDLANPQGSQAVGWDTPPSSYTLKTVCLRHLELCPPKYLLSPVSHLLRPRFLFYIMNSKTVSVEHALFF